MTACPGQIRTTLRCSALDSCAFRELLGVPCAGSPTGHQVHDKQRIPCPERGLPDTEATLDGLGYPDKCFHGSLQPTLEVLMARTVALKDYLSHMIAGLPDAIVQVHKFLLIRLSIIIVPQRTFVLYQSTFLFLPLSI